MAHTDRTTQEALSSKLQDVFTPGNRIFKADRSKNENARTREERKERGKFSRSRINRQRKKINKGLRTNLDRNFVICFIDVKKKM